MNFKVGDRVRLVRAELRLDMIGAEGVVVGCEDTRRTANAFGEIGLLTCYLVRLPGCRPNPNSTGDWGIRGDFLEPILPNRCADILAAKDCPRGPVRDPTVSAEGVVA
jgi:hypothetical protein